MRLDEGHPQCGKEPSGAFPPLQSVVGGLATLPKRFGVRSTTTRHLN